MYCSTMFGSKGRPLHKAIVSYCCLFSFIAVFLSLTAKSSFAEADKPAGWVIKEVIPVSPVWAGHPVGFSLLTEGNRQFAAFYDSERRMTVGSRGLDSREWTLQQLPSALGWDSHNYVTMALDKDGFLHVCGNMHGDPLIYFRSEKPYDVTSLKRIETMVGPREQVCTYPVFSKGPTGDLIINYRDGSSRDGRQIYNIYDAGAKKWTRLLDEPLCDGEGRMNAYFEGPTLGPDGYYHLTWIWRNDGGCEFNHDLCYAKSRDLVLWETASGLPIQLPILFSTPGVIVDPIPVEGGMLNGNGKAGFDSQGRVILAYHKFDEDGSTQLYNARREGGAWKIYQTSDWNYRWFFKGGGSIQMEIRVGPATLRDGQLVQKFSHKTEGRQTFILDQETLLPIQTVPQRAWPAELIKPKSAFPGLTVNRREDLSAGGSEETYILRWETLPKFRDKPRPEPWPEASLLEVYRVEKSETPQK